MSTARGVDREGVLATLKRLYHEVMEMKKWIGYVDIGVTSGYSDAAYAKWSNRAQEIIRIAEEIMKKHQEDEEIASWAELVIDESKSVLRMIDSHLYPWRHYR